MYFTLLFGFISSVCLFQASPVPNITLPLLRHESPNPPDEVSIPEAVGKKPRSFRKDGLRNNLNRALAHRDYDEDEEEWRYNRKFRKSFAATRRTMPRAAVRPERREKCDDDRDCHRSPSQICVKHAGESFGRCQCPFYRPVEAAIGGVLRCVTAKDLFEECQATEECRATNPYLQCVDRLCTCLHPFVLKDQTECVSNELIPGWAAWVIGVSVVTITGVLLSAFFVSKRKKPASGSSNTNTTDYSTQPDANSCSRQQPDEQQPAMPGLGSRYDRYGYLGGYQSSGTQSRSNFPLGSDWPERTTEGSAGYDSVRGSTAGHAKAMWAKQAFQSMAAPIYQSKLVKRLMTSRGASGPHTDSSSAEPQTLLPPRTSSLQRPTPPGYSEVPRPDLLRKAPSGPLLQRSSQHQQGPPPTATFSDEASSFRSFPVPGGRSERSSQRYEANDQEDEEAAPPARLRSRSSSPYHVTATPRDLPARSQSNNAVYPSSSRRRVFFANYGD